MIHKIADKTEECWCKASRGHHVTNACEGLHSLGEREEGPIPSIATIPEPYQHNVERALERVGM